MEEIVVFLLLKKHICNVDETFDTNFIDDIVKNINLEGLNFI